MAELADSPLGPVVESPADDLVEAAWEAPTPAERRALAEKALARDPDCIDAHALLAALADDEATRLAHVRAAVAAGARLWAPLMDEPLMDWGRIAGPRPWMRAMLDLAAMAPPAESRDIVARLLELDPEDRLGARAILDGPIE